MISGGVISGYWAIGSFLSATTPTRIMMMEITIATIGRLTKNFATAYCFSAGLGVRPSAAFS
jgi:hypothetical protein